MTRIAIIGSSHVAAIKSALDEIGQDYPEFDVQFLAIGGKKFSRAYLRNDMRFGLPDSMLSDENIMKASRHLLDLSQFDVVWNVGTWGVPQAMMNEILLGQNIDKFGSTGFRHHMSDAAFDAIVDDLVARSIPGPAWRNWDATRLFYTLIPPRNALILDRKRYQSMDLRNHKVGWDHINAKLANAMARFAITNIAQPSDTLNAHGFTQSQYGSDRKLIQTRAQDMSHMNTAFGKRMWQQFLETSALGPRREDNAKRVQ